MTPRNPGDVVGTPTQSDQVYDDEFENSQLNIDRTERIQIGDDQTKLTDGHYNSFNPWADDMPTTVSQYDLTNEIHPVFAKERFDEAMDYVAITPALRLATRLITTDCLMDYWYAILCTTPVDEPEEEDGEEGKSEEPTAEAENDELEESRSGDGQGGSLEDQLRPELEPSVEGCTGDSSKSDFVSGPDCRLGYFSMYRKSEGLGQDDLSQVKALLELLAPAVFITTGMYQGSDANTMYSGERMEAIDDPHCIDWKRWKTRTELDRSKYNDVVKTYHAAPGATEGQFPRRLIELYYDLATFLVHELTHVAHIVRFGRCDISFEDNAVSENGYDWEAVVFGGTMDQRFGRFGGIMQWPRHTMHGGDGPGLTVRRGPDNEDGLIWWEVRQEYYPPFLQTAFWEKTVKACGADAVKVPKEGAERWYAFDAVGRMVWNFNNQLLEATQKLRSLAVQGKSFDELV